MKSAKQLRVLSRQESYHAKIFRGLNNRAHAWNGFDPGLDDEKKWDRSNEFWQIDKTDFLIPPFAFFYFYLVFAHTFNFPTVSTQEFFHSGLISCIGVFFCLGGLSLLLWSLVSFGQSFRVGIDIQHPDKLITTGVFAFSRNPIYVAFASILLGQFLIFSNWIILVYVGAGIWLFHRQVLREEDYLKQHYGKEYLDYCNRVRRYL